MEKCLHIYHFFCSPFFCEDPHFCLVSFFFALRPIFNTFCNIVLMVMNSLSFSLKKVFISSSFLNHILASYRIMFWPYSPWTSLKMFFNYLLVYKISYFFICNVYFSLNAFMLFFLSQMFIYLIIVCLLWFFVYVQWGSLKFLDLWVYSSHTNLENTWQLFLQMFF